MASVHFCVGFVLTVFAVPAKAYELNKINLWHKLHDHDYTVEDPVFVLGSGHDLVCELYRGLDDPVPGPYPLMWTKGDSERFNGTRVKLYNFTNFDTGEHYLQYQTTFTFFVREGDDGQNITCTADLGKGEMQSASITIRVYNSTLCDTYPCRREGGDCSTHRQWPNQYTCLYRVPYNFVDTPPDPCETGRCGENAVCNYFEPYHQFTCEYTVSDFNGLIGR